MITVVTGTPGAGKTLITLGDLLELLNRKKFVKSGLHDEDESDRNIVYFHVPELDEEKTGFTEMSSPQDWQDYPTGTLFLIDEAHNYFPKTGTKQIPDYISKLSEHRHSGYDFILISQNYMMINHHVRSLAGEHIHYERQAGWEQCTQYKWFEISNPKDYHDKQKAQTKRKFFKNYKWVYGLYKSSDEHNVKKTIPRVVIVFVLILLFTIVMVYYVYTNIINKKVDEEPQVPQKHLTTQPVQPKHRNTDDNDSFDDKKNKQINKRYNKIYTNKEIINGFYPIELLNPDRVIKSYVQPKFPSYEFEYKKQRYKYTRQQIIKDFGLKIQILSECRDVLEFPELRLKIATICKPHIVVDAPLQSFSPEFEREYSKRSKFASRDNKNDKNQRPLSNHKKQSVQSQIPKNPLEGVFN